MQGIPITSQAVCPTRVRFCASTASRLSDAGTLLCIDRDDEALQNAETRLAPVRQRVRLCKSDFRKLDEVLAREGFDKADGILFDLGVSSPQLDHGDKADGILFDLGVSSPQLDHGERGFSYMQDAPLDMRMDRQQALTAYDVVNTWSREDIRRILFEYGEERYAPLIAAAIERRRAEKPIETTLELVDIIKSAMPAKAKRILFEYGEERYAPLIAAAIERRRAEKPIETTLELVDIIKSAMPAKAKREKQHPAKRSFQAIRIAVNDELGEKQHPAKRSFQAIRIAVNDELGAVAEAMDKAIDVLAPGGRLAVITFHSLEDRIVKTAFQKAAQGCICPKDFPVCVCGRKPRVKIITRKPIVPDSGELAENARARSAKLRVCEKI